MLCFSQQNGSLDLLEQLWIGRVSGYVLLTNIEELDFSDLASTITN